MVTAGWLTCLPLKTWDNWNSSVGLETVSTRQTSRNPSSTVAPGAIFMPPPVVSALAKETNMASRPAGRLVVQRQRQRERLKVP